MLTLLLACAEPLYILPDSGSEAPRDSESAPSGPQSFEGTEALSYAYWVDDPSQRNCELVWQVEGVRAAEPCEVCDWSFDLHFTLDEEQSWDDGTCAAQAVDKTYTYGYAADYEDRGPSLFVTGFQIDFFWAYADYDGETLSWWFGVEEWQDTEYDDEKEHQHMRYITNWSTGSATVR